MNDRGFEALPNRETMGVDTDKTMEASTMDRLDVDQRWPELFEELSSEQHRMVIQVLASGWHEGWVPNREDVENLTDRVRGAITSDEYHRRVRAASVRRRSAKGN